MKELITCSGHLAQVDDDIYLIVKDHFWHFNEAKVYRTIKTKIQSLHRLVLGDPPDDSMVIDHIDRNPLNNQRSNLRFATPQQNSFNRAGGNHFKSTSKYKGVSKVKSKWRSTISHNDKKHHLGYHATEASAALAYNLMAKELFGVFAFLNDINGEINE